MQPANEIPKSADIVVIGGGVIGLAVARALALKGAGKVLLIERASLGSEASSAAGGMLAPQSEADVVDDFFQLACQSRDLYPDFARALHDETGIDVELDTTGTLYLALTDADQQDLETRYELQKRAALDVEKLTAAEARRLEPAITESVYGALRFPKDFQVENRRLIAALTNSCCRFGVLVVTGTTVESVLLHRSAITGVETSRGVVNASTVIVAAGALAGSIKNLPPLRIEPVRGQMVCLATETRLTRHVIYSPRGYLVPRQDGRVLAGSTSEHVGFDNRVTAAGVHSILTRALEISPAIQSLSITDFWAGLRPRAADGLPVLGPCAEIEGLVYAAGHYRNGILLAPITGELLAAALADRVASPFLKLFSPDRFGLVAA
jgi:glycine oxidase